MRSERRFSVFARMRVAAAALLMLGAVCSAAAAAEKTGYGFVIPLGNNYSSETMVSMLNRVAKVFSEQVGVTFQVYTPEFNVGEDSVKVIKKYFDEGKADFAYVDTRQLMAHLDRGGGGMYPVFTISMFDKTMTDVCMYVRKKDGLKDVKGLKGKVWGGPSTASVYRFLHQSGIKEPPEKFLSKMVFVADVDRNDLVDALLGGKIDVFTGDLVMYKATIGGHKRGKEVQKLTCAEHFHNWVFVTKNGTQADFIDKARKLFYRAHKDKAFQEFWMILTALEARFVPIDDKTWKKAQEMLRQEVKMGWYQKDAKFSSENWVRYEKTKGKKK